jgi:Na+/glutamate symporter
MRHFLLLVFFSLATLLSKAQAPVTPAPLGLASSEVTLNTDTVAALHNFYKHKRHALPRVLLITSGLFALTLFINDIFSEPAQNLSGIVVPLYVGALSIPVLGGEVLYYSQYNKRHERRSIKEFRAHQLRPYIQEQLEPKYFQPAPPAK